MTRLQETIQSLCEIILSYGQSQPEQGSKESWRNLNIEALLKNSNREIFETLQTVINDSTRNYTDRQNLMDYFLFNYMKLKPLVDQPRPLSPTEIEGVSQDLKILIQVASNLLKTSHNNELTIVYDGKSEKLIGCTRGLLKRYTLSNSGQLIERLLLQPLSLTDYSEKSITSLIDRLINEHQQQFSEQKNEALKQENELLKQKNDALAQENEEMIKRVHRLEEEVKLLKYEKQELEEEKKSVYENKPKQEEEKQFLLDEIENLMSALARAKEEHERQLAELQSERNDLKQKVVELRYMTTPIIRGTLGHRATVGYHPFFNAGLGALLKEKSLDSTPETNSANHPD
ncbi:hypothetical protein [Legionella jordanis]|uniref:Uncharacterized protein n=1 Tax=Legionella jordanis TaxID=456 RepID=A0A0W0V8N0_9GAMM|nr:hypothetical protein [Legionella jordanis]KTD16424.1 hypothetical protein Ljor_0730 [Legionella jordanis]RMX04374.1 hypothetical protein EAW55_02755 [Legionella jordanis]RMX15565.1 hypothetical protein EAS68_11950 [Legionella jordanis]VEH12116.1 Uncharacterised protein [Legionella jordanis]HAT8714987.1 hypothetical protein [Legionella jordanis]